MIRSETGAITKRWRGRRSVAVVFPDSYGLGMANLGFQRVYELLNADEDIVAERFFFSPHDFDLRSLESNRHLSEFDTIVFSISFELSYLNVAQILLRAGIPPLRRDRPDDAPLVLAGGIACQMNPAPIADFVDAFVLGDFEAVFQDLAAFLTDLPKGGSFGQGRQALLGELSDSVAGIYCPGSDDPSRPVTPAISMKGLATVPHTVVVSSRSSFADTFLVEITRGCGRGCRFCAAGFVYRPPRNWPEEAVYRTLSDTKGARKIGLVGLEYAGRGFVSALCETLLERDFQLGFSSLRADAVTDEFVRLLVRSKNYTATIAPEAGSERLRRVINKNLEEDQIIDAADRFFRAGIGNLKLYFMIGLPTEEDSDVEEIARLSLRIRNVMLGLARAKGRAGSVVVSVGTFVPKPWTPFQWAAFVDMKVLDRRRDILRKALVREPNVKLRLDSPEDAVLQALLSRGDEKLGRILTNCALKGMGRKRAVKEIGNIAENYLKERALDEPLPWDVVGHRVRRQFLLAQWRKARDARQTSFCSLGSCRRCGACTNRDELDE